MSELDALSIIPYLVDLRSILAPGIVDDTEDLQAPFSNDLDCGRPLTPTSTYIPFSSQDSGSPCGFRDLFRTGEYHLSPIPSESDWGGRISPAATKVPFSSMLLFADDSEFGSHSDLGNIFEDYECIPLGTGELDSPINNCFPKEGAALFQKLRDEVRCEKRHQLLTLCPIVPPSPSFYFLLENEPLPHVALKNLLGSSPRALYGMPLAHTHSKNDYFTYPDSPRCRNPCDDLTEVFGPTPTFSEVLGDKISPALRDSQSLPNPPGPISAAPPPPPFPPTSPGLTPNVTDTTKFTFSFPSRTAAPQWSPLAEAAVLERRSTRQRRRVRTRCRATDIVGRGHLGPLYSPEQF